MQRDDRVRILHILDSCESVRRFIEGRQREDLDSNEMLLFALVRAIEVIGEAAARVSQESREFLPDVPWTQVTSMRNRLIHAYFDVDRDIVWRTATEDVPKLARALEHVRLAK
ncbi:MAG: HepT-like ribonuclease domain-containing protein [Thermoanaerobaculia bacterium]